MRRIIYNIKGLRELLHDLRVAYTEVDTHLPDFIAYQVYEEDGVLVLDYNNFVLSEQNIVAATLKYLAEHEYIFIEYMHFITSNEAKSPMHPYHYAAEYKEASVQIL